MTPPHQVETLTFPAADVTDEMLRECAALFVGHYGFWGDGATRANGTRVTLSVSRLRSGYLKMATAF